MLNWIQDDFFFLVAAFAVVVAFLIFIARRRLWEIRYDNSRVVMRVTKKP
jgi:hypothetical protein